MSLARVAWVVLLTVGFAWTREAAAEPDNPHLQEAKQLVDEFKDRQALQALHRAARWKGNNEQLRAEIHLYRGIAYFNLFKPKRARKALRRALIILPTVELPPAVSPKIQQLFDKVRASLPPAIKPEPAEPKPPEPKPEPEVEPEYAPPPQRPARPPDDELASRSSPTNWPAWLAMGLSLAAGGAGVAMGFAARSAQDDANDTTQPWVVAETHYLNASDRALGANILFGVAGAAAITAVVLFWTGRDKPRRRSRAVSVSPTGVMVELPIGGGW